MSQPAAQLKPNSYSHLLYLNEIDRESLMASNMSRSVSSASLRSAASASLSINSYASTPATSISSASVSTPKWAGEHYPLITATNPESVPESVSRSHACFWIAREMAQVHNTLIRALNASYNHALFIQPDTQDAADFLFFNQMIFKTLEHHHHTEDDFLLPELEKMLKKPGAMEENTKGHESFAEGLAVYGKYISVSKPSEFNGRTLRHIISSFAPDLIQHLHDEIPTLLSLHVLDSAELKKVWTAAGKLATKVSDLYTDAPFVLGCQDRDLTIDGQKCTFPDVPWIAEAIVRKWHSKRHANAWKFLPCDLNGKRRQMIMA